MIVRASFAAHGFTPVMMSRTALGDVFLVLNLFTSPRLAEDRSGSRWSDRGAAGAKCHFHEATTRANLIRRRKLISEFK